MKSLENRLYEGARAREILDNEVFSEAFDAIEREVIETWKNSPPRAEADRERLWQYLTLLTKVRTHISNTMETGKLAELELNHKRTLAERARAFLG